MDHAGFRELAAGAALDDLEPAEQAVHETHLGRCASCAALVDDLLAVTADLSLAVPQRRPPDTLLAGIMSAIDSAGPGRRVALRAVPDAVAIDARTRTGDAARDGDPVLHELAGLRRTTRRLRALGVGGLAIAAVLALAVAGLGARTIQLDAELATARTAAASAQADLVDRATAMSGAMAVAIDPRHAAASLRPEPVAPTASAVVLYRPGSDQAYIMATDLPATPAGHVYQVWVADGSGVHGLGTFHYDGRGAFVAPIGRDLGSATATMVTLEGEGGAQGEPGPQVVFGEL